MSTWGGSYFGGRDNVFGPIGDRPVTVDSQPVIRALKMLRKFVYDEHYSSLSGYQGGFIPNDALEWTGQDAITRFRNRNAIACRGWPRSISLLARANKFGRSWGDALGAMPMPYAITEDNARYPGTGGTNATLDGWHFTVNPNTNRGGAVLRVLEIVTRKDFQLKMLNLLGWLPPRPDLFTSREAKKQPLLGRFMDTFRVAGENAMPPPLSPVWREQSPIIAKHIHRVLTRQQSAELAMKELKSELQTIEDSYRNQHTQTPAKTG
jgi:ABC-type glycerol-3-phosphate transport system substrate-binding protein